MKTTLRTDLTIAQVCDGFVYNELEGKGLFGLSGKLTIQPEYQRNYLYQQAGMETAVIQSVLKGYPLGVIYFNTVRESDGSKHFEILDGQQRITSLGRFLTRLFAIEDETGMPRYYDSLPKEKLEKIQETRLLIYECEGEEAEIKEWFRTINIAGIQLKPQEILNAVYSGEFVTQAKETFSNSQNANVQKWGAYVKGDVNRQDFLAVALDWISKKQGIGVEEYMSLHRRDTDIRELETCFRTVIEWVSGVFPMVEKEMCGLPWGDFYRTYHHRPYDPAQIRHQVEDLYNDPYVHNRRGVFEYVLDGCEHPNLLDIRVFDDAVKRKVYKKQTESARKVGRSNCPLCAIGHGREKVRIYDLKDMEADHVTAWSKGGATDVNNCQMLCRTHNRSKGNK